MYYTYILLLKNKDLYKGSTSNLKQRIKDHNNSKVNSTKKYLPAKLIHYEVYKLKSDAQRRERFLKTTEGQRLLKQRLRDILNNNGV